MSPLVEAGMVRRAAERIPPGAGNNAGKAEALLPVLGWVDFHFDHNLPAALKAFARSSHLPHDPWTTRVRVLFALSRRRFGQAIDLLGAAIALDPCSPWLHALLAWSLHLAGDSPASVTQIRKALAQFPGHDGPNLFGAIILSYIGEVAHAAELANELAVRSRYFDLATAVHAYALACAGCGDDARELLDRLQWLSRERFVMNTFNAAVYVALGEPGAALAELRASLDSRCPWFFQMLADPRLKPLHSRPEFEQMRGVLADMEADAQSSAMD
jgi:tetratricopeptide (TPR) repeat protein